MGCIGLVLSIMLIMHGVTTGNMLVTVLAVLNALSWLSVDE